LAGFLGIQPKNAFMKASRLLAYGVIGIIGGLLMENCALVVKQDTKDKINSLKNKMRKTMRR